MPRQTKRTSNRKNALRSTGPRSVDGKARSAQNARRHGIMSEQELSKRRAALLAEGVLSEITGPIGVVPSNPAISSLVDAVARLEIIDEAEIASTARLAACFPSGAQAASDEVEKSEARETLFDTMRLLARYRSEAASKRRRALRALTANRRSKLME